MTKNARMNFRLKMSLAGSEADIRLYSDIGESFWGDSISASEFADQLDEIGPVSVINLYVNSAGGDVFDASAMMNALMRHPAQVNVFVDGMMASAATFMLAAADEVVMGVNSQLIIHDAWSIAVGDAADMREQADVLDKLSGQIATLYAQRAGGTADDWRQLMLAETWFTAQEAVDSGLADRVAGELTDAPEQSALARFQFHGRAEAPDPMRAVALLRKQAPAAHTTPRPIRDEVTPDAPASTRKETAVTDTVVTPEQPAFDQNAIDNLLKLQRDGFENKLESFKTEIIDQLAATPAAPAPAPTERPLALREFTQALAALVGGRATDSVRNRLKDALTTPDTVWNAFQYGTGGTNTIAPDWVGELVNRAPYVNGAWSVIAHDDLTGPTVAAWAMTTAPAGGDYAGGGAVVTSTAPVISAETVSAARYALAAGLDRINWDFGVEGPLVTSFIRSALYDYYKWRDGKTVNAMLGSSTGFFGALTAATATKAPTNSVVSDTFNKIVDGIVNVVDSNGGLANFALLNSADFKSLAKNSFDQQPAFLNASLAALVSGTINQGFNILIDQTGTLTAGQVIVGNGGAGMTGYELPGGPVRVQQVVTATGTIDFGVFGYAAPVRNGAIFFSLVNAVATT